MMLNVTELEGGREEKLCEVNHKDIQSIILWATLLGSGFISGGTSFRQIDGGGLMMGLDAAGCYCQ